MPQSVEAAMRRKRPKRGEGDHKTAAPTWSALHHLHPLNEVISLFGRAVKTRGSTLSSATVALCITVVVIVCSNYLLTLTWLLCCCGIDACLLPHRINWLGPPTPQCWWVCCRWWAVTLALELRLDKAMACAYMIYIPKSIL